MEKKIQDYIKIINPKNKKEELFALSLFVINCIYTEDLAVLSKLDKNEYMRQLKDVEKFNDNDIYMQTVYFGELAEFSHKTLTEIKKGEISKKEALSGVLRYFEEYIL